MALSTVSGAELTDFMNNSYASIQQTVFDVVHETPIISVILVMPAPSVVNMLAGIAVGGLVLFAVRLSKGFFRKKR